MRLTSYADIRLSGRSGGNWLAKALRAVGLELTDDEIAAIYCLGRSMNPM